MDSTRLSTVAGGLLCGAALTLGFASLLHFGVAIPVGATTISDPFAGAAIPEAVLAVVVAAGAMTLLAGLPVARWLTPATTLLALAGTLYGLTVTLARGEPGDVVYHLALLTILVVSALLLLLDALRRPRVRTA
jgi:hypothetical protein